MLHHVCLWTWWCGPSTWTSLGPCSHEGQDCRCRPQEPSHPTECTRCTKPAVWPNWHCRDCNCSSKPENPPQNIHNQLHQTNRRTLIRIDCIENDKHQANNHGCHTSKNLQIDTHVCDIKNSTCILTCETVGHQHHVLICHHNNNNTYHVVNFAIAIIFSDHSKRNDWK